MTLEENLKQKLYYWVLCKIPTLNLDCMCIIKGQELVLPLWSSALQITYLVNFFETLEKQLFMGNENEEEDVFFFLLLFIHNGFYHALIPLYCFEDPFHLHCVHFLTEMDSFAWTPCTEFMRN